ncbi:MAG TPA: nitroreductase family deazaflavin-dependent oxidoreductase [Cellulomonas sp.]|uniref:nitroreductase family deazaflavin-dependent oxidoreductase n=1 Tax=Cellulomonas sp. TaxID=40001 RepID=UPI002E3717DF|nr:nitroreductase family deazaflavin-dependent oxidoreductase [Cellulomonas sp.]HEX5331888.1 nitroreductase family deazaflavin-dependent oxidoreductase [Cellulomonas sp.]
MGLARRLTHLATHAHARLYRWTGGRVLGRFGHLEQVLLTTTGRRTGAPRTVPLAATPVGSSVVLVASDGGAPGHPAWYLNLTAHPEVLVQRGRRTVPMLARIAVDPERDALWAAVVKNNPGYARYQEKTAREIPIVVCEPPGPQTRPTPAP